MVAEHELLDNRHKVKLEVLAIMPNHAWDEIHVKFKREFLQNGVPLKYDSR